jgi:hypothetical protein
MRKLTRISDDDEPLSLNSLLDTLMNVVGVSLILLAAANLSLIRATKQIHSSGIPQDISEKLSAERAKNKLAISVAEPTAGEVSGQSDDTQERRRLSARLELLKDEPAIDQGLLDQLAASQRSLKALQDESSDLDAKIAALKADSPKPSSGESRGAQGTIIQLPVVHTIPRQLEQVTVICRNGRAWIVDSGQLSKALTGALQIAKARLTSTMTTLQQIRSVVSYFDTVDVGDKSFRLSLKPVIQDQQFRGFAVLIVPRNLDSSAGNLPAMDPVTVTTLRHLDPSTQFIHFLVWADSFQFYLSLRGDLERYYSGEGNRGTKIGLSWTAYAMDEDFTSFLDSGGSSPRDGHDAKGTEIDNP